MKHVKRQKSPPKSKGEPNSYSHMQGSPVHPKSMPNTMLADPQMMFDGQSMPLPPGAPGGMDTTRDTDSDGM